MSNILERILHETTRGYTSKLASERKIMIWTYLVICHIFYSQRIDRQTESQNKKGASILQCEPAASAEPRGASLAIRVS